MTEVLTLPSRLFGKSSSTEELNTLHAWPSDISPPAISIEEQRDLHQITQFRERIEKEIEVRRYWLAAVTSKLSPCNVGSETSDKEDGTGIKSSAGIRADNSARRKVIA